MASGQFRWDDFVLDIDSYRLERDGLPVSLEPKAFNLLVLMVARPGHLFTKQEIFDAVWPATAVSDHALTRVVAQLRRALGDEAREARYLETVPTRGYRWIRSVERDEAATVETPSAATSSPRWSRPNVRLVVVVVLVCLAAAVGTWLLRSRAAWSPSVRGAAGVLSPQFPVQVTTHDGLDLHPALSPAGDAIAFASDRGGTFEIHVRALGSGGADIAITSDGAQNVQPAWSPDGRFIAYHSASNGGVWVMPARGGVARQIAPHGSAPKWAADGRRIVFQSDEQADIAPTGFGAQIGSTIWIVDVDGGAPTQLTTEGHPAGGHGAPAWSHDGRHVVFSVFDGGDDDGVWVADVESKRTWPIEREIRGYESTFGEGDRALYVAGGTPVVYRIPFDPVAGERTGPSMPIVVPSVAGVRGLSIGADGRTLAFAGLALGSHIWVQPVARDGRPTGSAHALTTDTRRRSYAPSVSPDGARVAYMSARRGEASNVWVVAVEGDGEPVQLTDDAGIEWAPSWFGDSRRVAYISESGQGARGGIQAVDVFTRRSELVRTIDSRPEFAPGADDPQGRVAEMQLSPSVERLAFSVAASPFGRRRLYLATIEPFVARALSDGTRSIGYPAWSPDEQRIAVQIQEAGATHLGVVDVATGELRQVTHERGQIWVRSWSPDRRRVVAAVLRNRLWSLEWFDVSGGGRGVIVPPGPANVYYRYPEWSPRGDSIIFERGEMRGNIWTLRLLEP